MINKLKALLQVAAKKDVRYYLNGVHIKSNNDGSFIAESSDGHIMMRLLLVADKNNVKIVNDTDVIVNGTQLATMLKMFNARQSPEIIISNESVTINGYNVELVDGRYPSIDRVLALIKPSSGTCEIGVDFKLMVAVCKACSLIVGQGMFTITDAISPILIERGFNDSEKLTAAIMPCRL